jgi:pyruvate/2-oxoglutarate/acetoin dehydrogenase E1 component
MFNEQVSVPIVIRTPMGGGRGYGPTHSQSLESLFMSVPGLKIVAPSVFHNPGKMLKQCVTNEDHPSLFIENKSAYPKELILGDRFDNFYINRITEDGAYESLLLSLYPGEKIDALIITYGGMSEMAVKCAKNLFMDEEILVDVLILGSVKPLQKQLIINHAARIGRILVLEEGNMIGGWGAEVSSIIHEGAFMSLDSPVQRLGSKDLPIPSAMPMENEVLPTLEKLNKLMLKLTYDI